MTDGEEPMSPAARLFHSRRVNCYIVAAMVCRTSIDPSLVRDGLGHTLINHPRFSSKLVKGRFGRERWKKTTVNLDDHVIIPNLSSDIENPDEFTEHYISNITLNPLDLSKPLWELHLLNLKTMHAEAVGIFRIHHSLGDGASLISLLLACTRQASDPNSLPSVPVTKPIRPTNSVSGFWWVFSVVWSVVRLVWNTFVDMAVFVATIIFLKDTLTPIKGSSGTELTTKKFVHHLIEFDHVKQVKNAMNMTVNDVLLGITQFGLTQYLNRSYAGNLPKNIRLRATVLVNLRPSSGIQALADMMAKGSKYRWGNSIGYILLPFKIGLRDNPLDYLRQAKATIDRKKLSLEAVCSFASAKLMLNTLGVKATAAITHRVFSNTTMAFSSMVGPIEEISFYGHPISYIAPTVYGQPHALTIHFQSYANKMIMSLAVDSSVIPDAHLLCEDIQKSLFLIRESVLQN